MSVCSRVPQGLVCCKDGLQRSSSVGGPWRSNFFQAQAVGPPSCVRFCRHSVDHLRLCSNSRGKLRVRETLAGSLTQQALSSSTDAWVGENNGIVREYDVSPRVSFFRDPALRAPAFSNLPFLQLSLVRRIFRQRGGQPASQPSSPHRTGVGLDNFFGL